MFSRQIPPVDEEGRLSGIFGARLTSGQDVPSLFFFQGRKGKEYMSETRSKPSENTTRTEAPPGLSPAELAECKLLQTPAGRRKVARGAIVMEPPEVTAERQAADKEFEFGPCPEKDDPRYLEWRARKIRREDGMLLDSMRPAPQIDADKVEARAFDYPPRPEIRGDLDTESLLNGLIAECHLMMREIALPSALRAFDVESRQTALHTAMHFAQTGASVGKTIAKLRNAGQVAEMRQRYIVERVATLPLARENG
jgi:hypothetical protein